MKHFFAALFCLSPFCTSAQFQHKNLHSLVDAEHAFMTMAKEKNTRDAFVFFLRDDAVTFNGGNIEHGKKVWEARTPDSAWLYWEPAYTDIAASGDWGFNMGPWEYRVSKADEKPVAFGHFVTIWKKQNGEWRAAVDIGVSHPQPLQKESLTASTVKTISTRSDVLVNKEEVLRVEKDFIESLKTKNIYAQVLSREAKVLRPGEYPYDSSTAIEKLSAGPTSNIVYTPVDADIASSGDLAYVYGTATLSSLKDDQPKQTLSYMRIWKKEDGGKWKIVLDILS
jgi:ketosteroid isomerase-like protein